VRIAPHDLGAETHQLQHLEEAAYVHYGYAKLKFEQKMPGIAAKYAEKATQLDPLHARAWSLWGASLWYENNDDEEAWRLLELAHELAPEDQRIWFYLEQARQSKREREEAAAKNG
jgi:Flp pilus assembly protein TadD